MSQFKTLEVGRVTGQDRNSAIPLATTDFSCSAGFGSTASVTSVAGHDSAFTITIASTGSGQAYQPTCSLAWKESSWRKADGSTFSPYAVVSRVSGSQNTVGFLAAATHGTLTLTFLGTAASGETYTLTAFTRG